MDIIDVPPTLNLHSIIMAEAIKQAKTQIVDYLCDKCSEGWMRPNGIAYMSYPARYVHICNKCGNKDVFTENYPVTRLIEE